MSVQGGTWNFDGQPPNQDLLARMSHELAEYGPDGESRYVEQSVGMLYRAFQTTPESRFDQQPRHLSGGEAMTWDGRLDNRDELIDLLQIQSRSDLTDLAIVAAAFERWRTSAFERLIGDWALVVWDPGSRQLILAKDCMGSRTLFYYPKPTSLTWCTHLAPLVLCGDRFTLCDNYIAGYLASHPDAELTPYREIRAVPPASFVSIRAAGQTLSSYWRIKAQPITLYKTDAEYEEHYRHLFRQSVQRRLRSSSPILAELSGGLDSSSIVLTADSICAEMGSGAPRLETFSYHDSCEPEDDDLAYIRAMEQSRGKKGLIIDLAGTGDSFSLDQAAFATCPGFSARAEVQAPLQDLVRRSGCRVVLSGLGGDEINGQTLSLHVLVVTCPQFPHGDLTT